MPDLVYVHIDTTSNAILTQGITTHDFHQGIVHQPKNLLLLNPTSDLGDFEPSTGMKIIRGSEAVTNFFQLASRGNPDDNKWIDFTDVQMLKELSPLEISELLYFGHMKTHLHSPFFYKLQNNFVYFDLKDQVSRTYYRYLDEFYRILSNKITHTALEALNDRRGFFKKPMPVEKINIELIKSLREVMREGIVLSFKDARKGDSYQIPIYVVEDSLLTQIRALKEEELVGHLSYHLTDKVWSLDLDEDNLLLSGLPYSF